MENSKIALIGDVVIDVTLKTSFEDYKLRLGGVIHAARGLWALKVPFAVGYFAPSYLDVHILEYLESLGCTETIRLGVVNGAPNVVLINEVREVGDQGYEFLLRSAFSIEYDEAAISKLTQLNSSDCILFSGSYDITKVIDKVQGDIHIDLSNNIADLTVFEKISKKFKTIFTSTSSTIFRKYYTNDILEFSKLFEKHADKIIVKENRGGSRCVIYAGDQLFSIPAQIRNIVHSVGVGDVFDCVLVSEWRNKKPTEAFTLASWISAEYAATTYPDDFEKAVSRVLASDVNELINMGGVSLHWEKRGNVNIYIAAPDFDFVDTTLIDVLADSLQYHNFKPRRPIKENGQMEKDAPKYRRLELFHKDMALLEECSILIAVLLYNDPGTLIEIGLAVAKGVPTIVYDPYNIATNCMLTEVPTLLSSDLDEILREVFIITSKV